MGGHLTERCTVFVTELADQKGRLCYMHVEIPAQATTPALFCFDHFEKSWGNQQVAPGRWKRRWAK